MNQKKRESLEKLNKIKTFGSLIAEGRERKGYSKSTLSDKIANKKIYVSEKTISLWEKDLRYPDITMIYILAELLDINPTQLLTAKQLMQESGLNAIDMVTMRVVCKMFDMSIMGIFYLNRILFWIGLILALAYVWGVKIPASL